MSTYTFSCVHHDGTVVDMTFNVDTVGDVLDNFKMFLAGCGFILDPYAQLDFVPDEYHCDDPEPIFDSTELQKVLGEWNYGQGQ
jgi:hypothetical protein